MAKRTELERLQWEIDKCNHKNGCRSKCTPEEQKDCYKLQAHANRIRYMEEHNIPIWLG